MENSFVGFWHHGILCPDGSVIHFTDPQQAEKFSKDQAVIVRTSLSQFIGANDRDVYQVHYEAEEMAFTTEEIVERAESRIGQCGYNLIFNNCESFAQWCITGPSVSAQIENYTESISQATRIHGIPDVLLGLITGAFNRNRSGRRMSKMPNLREHYETST